MRNSSAVPSIGRSTISQVIVCPELTPPSAGPYVESPCELTYVKPLSSVAMTRATGMSVEPSLVTSIRHVASPPQSIPSPGAGST